MIYNYVRMCGLRDWAVLIALSLKLTTEALSPLASLHMALREAFPRVPLDPGASPCVNNA